MDWLVPKLQSHKVVLIEMVIGQKMAKLCPHSPNVSTTPITAMGCQQCLPLSVVQLKDKHCRKPHCRNGVVDMFGHGLVIELNWFMK